MVLELNLLGHVTGSCDWYMGKFLEHNVMMSRFDRRLGSMIQTYSQRQKRKEYTVG